MWLKPCDFQLDYEMENPKISTIWMDSNEFSISAFFPTHRHTVTVTHMFRLFVLIIYSNSIWPEWLKFAHSYLRRRSNELLSE